MALDDTDRRRFFLVVVASLLVVPTLWWFDHNGQPTDSGAVPGGASTLDSATGQSNLSSEPTVITRTPIFLDGPMSVVGGISEIAIPNADRLETIITSATFGRLSGGNVCLAQNITTGQEITVTNLDNNRSITCRSQLAPATQVHGLMLQTTQFETLADLTDAPIPVQIRL
ncbi:MAG: hypothetical protein P8N13_09675 [Ilumatobacter sp.]|nr:hypothetical protein [Ilumatobacter sp.]